MSTSEFSGNLDQLTREQTARLLGVTTRHLDSMTASGQLPCERDGRRVFYCWKDVWSAYIDRIVAKGSSPSVSEALRQKYDVERRRAEIKLAREAGEVVSIADVEREVTAHNLVVRTRLLAIPSRLGSRFAHNATGKRMIEVVADEVRQALTELARAEDLTGKNA